VAPVPCICCCDAATVLPLVLQERAAYRIDRVTDNLVALIQHLLREAGQKQVGSQRQPGAARLAGGSGGDGGLAARRWRGCGRGQECGIMCRPYASTALPDVVPMSDLSLVTLLSPAFPRCSWCWWGTTGGPTSAGGRPTPPRSCCPAWSCCVYRTPSASSTIWTGTRSCAAGGWAGVLRCGCVVLRLRCAAAALCYGCAALPRLIGHVPVPADVAALSSGLPPTYLRLYCCTAVLLYCPAGT
jgi:hypothetical protein